MTLINVETHQILYTFRHLFNVDHKDLTSNNLQSNIYIYNNLYKHRPTFPFFQLLLLQIPISTMEMGKDTNLIAIDLNANPMQNPTETPVRIHFSDSWLIPYSYILLLLEYNSVNNQLRLRSVFWLLIDHKLLISWYIVKKFEFFFQLMLPFNFLLISLIA